VIVILKFKWKSINVIIHLKKLVKYNKGGPNKLIYGARTYNKNKIIHSGKTKNNN